MRIARLQPMPRVAFLGDPARAIHVPLTCDWAEAHFFPARQGSWPAAVAAANGFDPEISIIFDPIGVDPGVLPGLAGIRVGVMTRPIDAAGMRSKVAEQKLGSDGCAWLTCLESVPPPSTGLSILQSLPLPIDTARALAGPRFERTALAVAEWAAPKASVLDRLAGHGPVIRLSSGSPVELLERVADCGTLLYCPGRPIDGTDLLPVLALANGMLLVSARPMPRGWGVEEGDEYLLRESAREHIAAVEAAISHPGDVRAIRARAWQRARETFAASSVFQRLVHEVLLRSSPEALSARVKPAMSEFRSRPRVSASSRESDQVHKQDASARHAESAALERALGEQQALLAQQGAEILLLSERLRALDAVGILPAVLPLRYRLVDRVNAFLKGPPVLRPVWRALKAVLSRR